MEKIYDPKEVESDVYRQWLEAGAFAAETGGENTYSIVIPPPNVTAPLHLGHALNNTLQDILIRQKRMTGADTLWMPGTDHAGIATQTVVEKRILAEEGRRRTDFARDDFVARIQAWKDEYEAQIIAQLKAMGCSCDWGRTRFTMDGICAKAVREAFFRLFAEGLIYRGKRLVNWDPATQTVLADDEVEHETVQGHFWYMKYPLTEPVKIEGEIIEHVTIATTRPETMLGDTAIAMNPADTRAKYLLGKKVRLPLVGRIIPIIADEHVVLPDPDSEDEKARFSTGFLKVTPAHDPDDWQIGQRHDLPIINVMAPDGSISDKFGWDDAAGTEAEQLLGMDRFEAREAIVEWFRKEDLLEDVRPYAHEVGHSYRSHVPIEPYLSDQWYIAVKKGSTGVGSTGVSPVQPAKDESGTGGTPVLPGTDIPVNSLAGLALMPLLDGRVKFTPERYAKTYQSWLENLRDWPISRQLWWGHRIPVWMFRFNPATSTRPFQPDEHAPRKEQLELFDRFCETCGVSDDIVYHQSSDLIDGHFPLYVCSRNERGDKALDLLWKIAQHRPGATSDEVRRYKIENDEFRAEFGEDAYKHANNLRGQLVTQRVMKPNEPRPQGSGQSVDPQSRSLALAARDPDVLDTWFSSALWPISTMGWPEETDLLKTFYPTDLLCTAREIITLWVSRMVMFGQYFRGDIPFSQVYIHAMIQDGQGRKMSKSLGNGIDPLDIIESHGADAMRFTLASMTTETQDVRMPVEEMTLPDGRRANTSPKFDIGRNFCNKLWNASRFALMNLQAMSAWSEIHPKENLSDRWILSRLNETVRDATAAIEAFRFNELSDTLYHFMWGDFCDWYLEIAKIRINSGDSSAKTVLAHCLDVLLRLLHPIIPFITEQIWSQLNGVAPNRGPGDSPAEEMLIRARWPLADAAMIDSAAEEKFELYRQAVRGVRNIRAEHNVPPKQRPSISFDPDSDVGSVIIDNRKLFESQSTGDVVLSAFTLDDGQKKEAGTFTVGGEPFSVLGVIDITAERARLTKQVQTIQNGITGIEKKLANEGFVAKAPAEVVGRERERLARLKKDLDAVNESLNAL
ncbi:MAG: valine--tRNA ligase [Planctomycetota bacterium]|nr:valine--tRNA ligase [Planctomycetota bacterium]